MKKMIIAAIGILVIIFLFSNKEQSKAEKLFETTGTDKVPDELKLEFHVERGPNGAIFIVGQTDLPNGMKLGVSIFDNKKLIGQDFDIIIKEGKFRSEGFTSGDKPHSPGAYKVEMLSYFNQVWQKDDVLNVLKHLRSSKIFKVHPDVIDSMLKLSDLRVLQFPRIQTDGRKTAEETAISFVKNAVLSDPKRGTSSKNVIRRIEGLLAIDLITPRNGWSARKQAGDNYEVEFDHIDTGKPYQAIWNVNIKTKDVKYINMSAKVFSIAPR